MTVLAKARLVKAGRVETFDIALRGTTQGDLETTVDYLEGQIGTVLCIYEVLPDGTKGRVLHKSLVEAWDIT